MKIRARALFAVAFLFAWFTPAFAQYSTTARVRPPYVEGELLLSLIENTSVPEAPGKTRADLVAAMGATQVSERRSDVDPSRMFMHVRLNAGIKLGRAYQIAQTFDFGSPARWTLQSVNPNGLAFAAVVGGTPPGGNRLFNFSARAEVRTGDGVTIGGIVVPGEFARPVMIKVNGPSLAAAGVTNALADPIIRFYQGSDLILQNDNWTTLREWEKSSTTRFAPIPAHPLESIIVTYLDPGIYTAVVSGADGGTGVALLEIYLVDHFYVY